MILRNYASKSYGPATSPLTMPLMTPFCPQNPVNIHKPIIVNIQKCGVKEFRGKTNDDLAKSWILAGKHLWNDMFNKASLRYAMSLLQEEVY